MTDTFREGDIVVGRSWVYLVLHVIGSSMYCVCTPNKKSGQSQDDRPFVTNVVLPNSHEPSRENMTRFTTHLSEDEIEAFKIRHCDNNLREDRRG